MRPKIAKPKTVKESIKPALKMRKIKLAGRSAFPQQPPAFGPADPTGGPAFSPGPAIGAAGGDTGG